MRKPSTLRVSCFAQVEPDRISDYPNSPIFIVQDYGFLRETHDVEAIENVLRWDGFGARVVHMIEPHRVSQDHLLYA